MLALDEAQKAIDLMDNYWARGRKIHVKRAVEREK